MWRIQNRKYFLNTNFISTQQHLSWFEKYKQNKNETIYIIYYKDVPVGMIGILLEKNGTLGTIGRVLMGNASYRRNGIMSEAFRILTKKLYSCDMYSLEVKKDNIPALKFYSLNGFLITRETKESYIMTYEKN